MKMSPSPASADTIGFDYGVFFLFSIVFFVGVMVYLIRKPVAKLLESEIKIEFRELGMDDADDVELGPGIMLVKQSKLDEKFVLEDSGSESEEDTT